MIPYQMINGTLNLLEFLIYIVPLSILSRDSYEVPWSLLNPSMISPN